MTHLLSVMHALVKDEFLVIKFCMTETEIMGSKWMCLLELNERIVSIQKSRACFKLSLTSAELKLFQSIHVVVTR